MCLLVLAQVLGDPTSISGGAGWLGAGLLGSVLAWLLMVHLPAKDKQLKEFITIKDDQIKAKDDQIMLILAKKWEAIQELSRGFQASVREVVEHCEKETDEMARKCGENLDKIVAAINKGK